MVLCVFLYQVFYIQVKEVPEIVQTVSEIQVSDTINLGILKFDTINPIISKNEQVQQIDRLIFDSLYEVNYDFKLEPCILRELIRLDDLTFIAKLRANVYWHDGSRLRADDISDVIIKIKENTDSIYFENVKNIKNAKVIDETTLRLELYEVEPFFKYNLIFPIVKNDMVGTGRYKYNDGCLQYNERYWKSINPSIITINLKMYEDMNELFDDFKSGVIDVINTKNSEYKNKLGEYGFNKKEYQGREYTYLKFNDFDKEVRQALCYAINKNEIISKIYKNGFFDLDFPMDTSSWLWNYDIFFRYDLEKSIQILEKNGWIYDREYWNKDKNKIVLTILIESTDKEKNDIAYLLQNQLAKVGIQIKIEKVSKNLYNYYLKNKNYDIIINTIRIGLSPSLNSFFEQNEAIESIEKSKDEKELRDLFNKLQDDFNLNVPFINLCCNKLTLLYSDQIHGCIRPNWFNVFYDIENWKKIIKNT